MRFISLIILLLSTRAYSLAYTVGYVEANSDQSPKYYVENGILFPTNLHLYLEVDGGIQTESYPGPYTESLIGLEYRIGGTSLSYMSFGAQNFAYDKIKEWRFLGRIQYWFDFDVWVFARGQLHVESGSYDGLQFYLASGYDFGPAQFRVMYNYRWNDKGQNKSSLDFRATWEAPKFDLFVEFRSQTLNNTTRNSAYVLGAFVPVYGIGNSGNYPSY